MVGHGPADSHAGAQVLVGNGTISCCTANTTDQGSVPATTGTTQISSAGIVNIGMDNFVDGISVCAVNSMGMVWGELRNIYAERCSGWGVLLADFRHLDIDNVRTTRCRNWQYYGALMPLTTMMPGNSDMTNLFTMLPRDTCDLRLCRGIVLSPAGLTLSSTSTT